MAQETKNPQRNMPIGILGSLLVCTILFILFGYVMTGLAHYTEFKNSAATLLAFVMVCLGVLMLRKKHLI